MTKYIIRIVKTSFMISRLFTSSVSKGFTDHK